MLLILTPGKGRADQLFSTAVNYETPPGPFGLAVGDLNLDGIQDLVAAVHDSGAVSIHIGKSDGTFEPRRTEYGPGGTQDVVVGRLDGDAYPDLAVTPGGSVLIYHGAGDGTFPTIEEIYIDNVTQYPQFARYIARGDFNADSADDLALSVFGNPGQIVALLSNGSGGFLSPVLITEVPGPAHLSAVDLNSDSKVDLVVALEGYFGEQNSIGVLLGNGNGTFGPIAQYGTGGSTIGLALGYLNNDSILDIAASTADSTVSILFGNGTGGFGANTDYRIGSFIYSLAVADFGGDGRPDIAVADFGTFGFGSMLRMLVNDGSGVFTVDNTYDVGPSPGSVVAGDFNRDGRVDLAAASGAFASPSYGAIAVLLNCVPCTSTAIEVALLDATSDGSGVHIRWTVSDWQGAIFTVERRTEAGTWQTRFGPEGITGSLFSFDDPDAAPGERYAYRLTVRSSEGTIITPETWVEAYGGLLPRSLVLDRPFPNPSSGAIRMRLGLPYDGPADLAVFDVSGRLVARVAAERRPAGWHQLAWDGRDQEGRPVASGTYFLRLTAGNTVSRRFVVLR